MKKGRKVISRLFLMQLLVLVAAVALTGWHIMSTASFQSEQASVISLKTQATLVETLVQGRFSKEHSAQLDALLKDVGAKTSARLTVFSTSGNILADSQEEPGRTEDYRPEVKEALDGEPVTITRQSLATNVRTTYFALPVKEDGRVVGVVRAAQPAAADFSEHSFYTDLAWGFALVVILAVVSARYLTLKIQIPITELRNATSRFAQMDLDHPVELRDPDEFQELADDLNSMAVKLSDRISSIRGQRNELEAILGGMIEAVLVVDTTEKVLRINRSAELLFKIQSDRVRNRSVQEAVRNIDLHRFVTKTLDGEGTIESDITIIGDPNTYLQAHGTALLDAQGNTLGAIVVLNDVTRLKNLEIIRRDFVANVSHELKTPITSVKGFLETLRDGAIDDPANAARFLEIAIKHTDRLNEIIEDLLRLSRIERDTERGEVPILLQPVEPVIESVLKACSERAENKGITIDVTMSDGLVARINPTLVEQAIINLVDNAIKFSEPDTIVGIECFRRDQDVVIRVRDHGCGIPKEHLGRIFERFYRVDKVRSPKVAGSGLGLSIVRHIVKAHNGAIAVESSVGYGSTFSISVPLR